MPRPKSTDTAENIRTTHDRYSTPLSSMRVRSLQNNALDTPVLNPHIMA